MKKQLTHSVLLSLSVSLSFLSCVNLRHINEFSNASFEGLEQYTSLTSSFTEVCLADQRQENIRKLDIHNTSSNCTENQKADSITRLFYEVTSDYFSALSNLSQNELTKYQTEALTQNLANGDFGPITLNENDIQAFSNLSTLLLRATTDGYRRKKLKQYISKAHKPLLQLLEFLQTNINDNLKGKLEVQKLTLKNFYFDLVRNDQLSTYERTKFSEDYFSAIENINLQQQKLEAYALVLNDIKEGHTYLYNQLHSLSDAEIKTTLQKYRSQIAGSLQLVQQIP